MSGSVKPPKRDGLDDAFGHWLAGFIDGEGSFNISRTSAGTYACHFSLTQRMDCDEVLWEAAELTGLGHIDVVKRERDASRPQTAWRIRSRDECVDLYRLLIRYPLRGAKRHDLRRWSQAVMAWRQVQQVHSARPRNAELWEQMAEHKRALEAGRAYSEDRARGAEA